MPTTPGRCPTPATRSFPSGRPTAVPSGTSPGGKLKTIEIGGTPSQTVCDATTRPRRQHGDPEGVIVFSPVPHPRALQVSASGGTPTPLTKLDPSLHTSHRWPFFLPDGKHFLYLPCITTRRSIEQRHLLCVARWPRESPAHSLPDQRNLCCRFPAVRPRRPVDGAAVRSRQRHVERPGAGRFFRRVERRHAPGTWAPRPPTAAC